MTHIKSFFKGLLRYYRELLSGFFIAVFAYVIHYFFPNLNYVVILIFFGILVGGAFLFYDRHLVYYLKEKKNRLTGSNYMVKQVWHRIRYVLFLAAAMAGYIFFHSYFFLTFFLLFFCLGIASIAVVLTQRSRLTLSIGSDKKIITGEREIRIFLTAGEALSVPIMYSELVLTCKNLFYPDRMDGTIRISGPIPSRGEEIWSEQLSITDVGILHFTCDQIRIWDWLGMLSFLVPVKAGHEIIIYPETVVSDKTNLQAFSEGIDQLEESMERGNDFPEIFQIREYQPGDSIRDIHWKLSAKERSFMVKERRSLAGNRIQIYVECFDERESSTEPVISLTGEILKHLVEEKIPAEILYFSRQLESTKKMDLQNEDSISYILEAIYREGCYESTSFLEEKLAAQGLQKKYLLITKYRQSGEELIFKDMAACYLIDPQLG